MSGINAIIYYAPRIYELTGLGKESALLSTAGIGLANLIFTMIGWYFIDRVGRRKLMYIGSFGYIISLGLITLSFYQESFTLVPLYIFVFIASHAIGQGSVIWVFISEIFPNSVRASGMAWGSLTHWVLAALVANFFQFYRNVWRNSYFWLLWTYDDWSINLCHVSDARNQRNFIRGY